MERKFISLTICLAMVLSLMGFSVTVSADANFSGSGTEADPFLIGTASDLTTLASLTNAAATASTYADKYYKLTADIDMTGVSYTPISRAKNRATAVGAAFTGTFDGDGHIVRNITLTPYYVAGTTYGLIGYVGTGGTVKNIGVENIRLAGDSVEYLCNGGIAGTVSGATIENCYVHTVYFRTTSTTNGRTFVGGIVGQSASGTIRNCYVTGTSFGDVGSKSYLGGIIGLCNSGDTTVTNCYTTYSAVRGSWNGAGTIIQTNNYASGTIANATSANLNAGGYSSFQTDPYGKSGANALLDWEIIFTGKGTSGNPFLISTASDLTTLASKTNTSTTVSTGKTVGATYAASGLYYKLTSDIDLSGISSFIPISRATDSLGGSLAGGTGSAFKGTLDGDGHIIRNITQTAASLGSYGGSYGIVGFLGSGGVIKNLGVENLTADGGAIDRVCIGGICGAVSAAAENPFSIQSCYVRGMTVTSTAVSPKVPYVGGIVGRTIGQAGTITNCYATNLSYTLSNANCSAGILGGCGNVGHSARNCYTTHSKVQGDAVAQINDVYQYMSSSNCYASGTIANATASVLNAEAFKNDVYEKNSGHAILKWEKDIDAVLTLTESAGTLTASASVTNYVGSARDFRLIIAKYNGAAETEVKNLSQAIVTAAASGTTADTATMTKDENTEYKAFLLYGSDFYPVVISQKLDFSE